MLQADRMAMLCKPKEAMGYAVWEEPRATPMLCSGPNCPEGSSDHDTGIRDYDKGQKKDLRGQ